MTRAAPDWPSKNTRALIAGKYDRLFQQASKLFGEELAYRMILRSVLGWSMRRTDRRYLGVIFALPLR